MTSIVNRNHKRTLYRHEELSRIFSPQSIAVIGATTNPDAFGTRTFARLIQHYQGRTYAINPKYDRIGEHPCFSSVAALPEKPDLAVIALPLEAVEDAVMDCARIKVGGVLIYASGYAETGHEDRILMQGRLTSIAKDHQLRILGPNCLGFFNFSIRAGISFTRSDINIDAFRGKGVAIVSQSGAMAFSQSQGAFRGISMSHVIASGNACDIDVADIVAYLAEDPACQSIICIFEGLSAPDRFIEAGRIAWDNDKPLIACKLGIGEAGARAALSHSGSLAGSIEGWRAAFERAGIIMLNDLDGLLETASFFAKAPRRPTARGIAAIGISGGALVATADQAENYSIAMPQPTPQVLNKLVQRVPEFGSPRNPCDVTAMASRDVRMIPDCVEALASDKQYCTVLYPQTTLFGKTGQELRLISEACSKYGKIATTVWMSGWLGGHGVIEAESDSNMAVFYSLNRYFWAIREWFRRDDRRHDLANRKGNMPTRISSLQAREASARIIVTAGSSTLTEREAKTALACYGIPVISDHLVQTADDAIQTAILLGFPVVLKVMSPKLPHKTEADVVRLNLKTPQEVALAFSEIMTNAMRICAQDQINGILVQPMVPKGIEVMVGGKIDPLFGPMIVVGFGGILVELIKDTAVELAPLTKQDALHMLARLKGRALFDGFRGTPQVSTEKLAEIIVRLAEFISDQSELVEEFDVNPLICTGSSIIAVDALIVRTRPQRS